MKKLFQFKEWLTIDETSSYLSILFEDKVSESDILRLALDGHLKLSINFVNHTQGKYGKVVDYDHVTWTEYPPEMFESSTFIPEEMKNKPILMMDSLNLDNDRYLNLEKEIRTISGVWDLPLFGGERLCIEHRYQMLTGGVEVTLTQLDGAFVERPPDIMCQLLESFDDNEFQKGSTAELNRLNEKIIVENLNAEEKKELFAQHALDRKKYLEKRKSRPRSDDYYPASSLPEDAVLVIRTSSLAEFENQIKISNSVPTGDKEITGKSETGYLNIIGALCDLYWQAVHPNKEKIIQSEIISTLEERYQGFSGLSERNLKEKISKGVKAVRNQ